MTVGNGKKVDIPILAMDVSVGGINQMNLSLEVLERM